MANTGKIGGMTATHGKIVTQAVDAGSIAGSAVSDAGIEVSTTTGKIQLKDAGTNLASGVTLEKMSKFAGRWIKGNLAASDATAGVFTEQNSYGTDLIVLRIVVFITTAATGSCTVDIGEGSSASSSFDNIIDGLNVGAGTGSADNLGDPGTNGHSSRVWKSGEHITASMASGATAGLVGRYAICVIDIN